MDGAGIIGQLALKVLANWAATWVAVDAYIPFTGETLSANHDRIEDDSLEGYGGRNPSEQGNQVLQGDTEHHWDYGADVLIPACTGILTGTVATVGEVLSEAACTADKYFGIEIIKGGAANHRFFPAMVTKFVIKGEKGGICNLTASWAARQFDAIAAAAITKPTVVPRVKFDQMVFRVGDQANALAAGDNTAIDSFEVAFDRSMKLDDYATDPTLPQQPLEPKENGFRVSSFKIKLPRYASDVFLVWRLADTPLQANMTWGGAGTTAKLIEFPELRITEGFEGNVSGPEVLTLEGNLEPSRGGAHGYMYAGNEMKITYTL